MKGHPLVPKHHPILFHLEREDSAQARNFPSEASSRLCFLPGYTCHLMPADGSDNKQVARNDSVHAFSPDLSHVVSWAFRANRKRAAETDSQVGGCRTDRDADKLTQKQIYLPLRAKGQNEGEQPLANVINMNTQNPQACPPQTPLPHNCVGPENPTKSLPLSVSGSAGGRELSFRRSHTGQP